MDKDNGEHENTHTEYDSSHHNDDAKIIITRDVQIFSFAVKLVALGILLYVGLTNLEKIFGALGSLYRILQPLLIGGLLALVLNAPMAALDRLFVKFGRRLLSKSRFKVNERATEIIALIMTFVLAVLLIYFIGNMIIPQLVESLKAVFLSIREYIPELLLMLEELEESGINTDPIVEWLNKIDLTKIIDQITSNAMNIINTVVSSASSIISATFTAVSALVFAIYILGNKKALSRQMKKLSYAYIKKSFVDRAIEICSLTSKTFSTFISGQCLDAVLLGVMCFFAMTVFGFPYALPISSMITVTAVIPYVGAFLGAAFGVLLIIIESPLRALLFVVLFIAVQQIDNNLVYPRVVGGSVGLPAIWTFVAVIVGGSMFGVIGMLLFIPLFSVLYTLLSKSVRERLLDRGITITDSSGVVPDTPPENRKKYPTVREHIDKMISKFARTGKKSGSPKNKK